MLETNDVCPVSIDTFAWLEPLAASNTPILPSSDAVYKSDPSPLLGTGAQLMSLTHRKWASRVVTSFPVVTSTIDTVPSACPAAALRPSGLKATHIAKDPRKLFVDDAFSIEIVAEEEEEDEERCKSSPNPSPSSSISIVDSCLSSKTLHRLIAPL
jgi:hypothetical protein